MSVHQELPPEPPEKETVLAIGVLDGVHLGHQRILERLKDVASQEGRLSGVLTFLNNPRSVLRPDNPTSYITSVEERLALLRESGVDIVIPLTFDLELSRLRAREFAGILQERLRMTGLVMGYNFAMGYKREGDPETLRALGDEMRFSITIVDAVSAEEERVSSTTIRNEVAAGNVARAAQFLGRAFSIHGNVVKGMARGKTLGFPTANLDIPGDQLLPGDGIYATWALVGEKLYMSATNVGTRPTFGESERAVEVFIFDYDGDLYDTDLRVKFVKRLRDEIRFDTPEALVAQMHLDVEQTRDILNRPAPSA
jgi:riboflavin kinase/FMN adenylyltransferase